MRMFGGLILGMAMMARAQATAVPAQAGDVPRSAAIPASARTGTVRGTVTDIGGALVPQAHIELSMGASAQTKPLATDTDKSGRFSFSGVTAGTFTLTVTAEGLQPTTVTGAVSMGGVFEVPVIAMRVAAANTDVQVTFTQEELGVEEVREMEKQRVLGVFPNFYAVYDWKAPPMTTRQKYDVAWKLTIDPVTLALTAGSAGIQQATNSFASFGPGWGGYGKRFAADFGTDLFATFFAGAVFPEIFKQDPRYFWKGTGTNKERTIYALKQVFVCRSDKDGHTMFNYSNVFGNLAAAGLSNAWYPAANREGAQLTLENGGIGLVLTGLGNIVEEFLLHHITPSVSKNPPSQR